MTELMAHADGRIRPNDDLFRYVNGRWLDSTTIPQDKATVGAFTDLRDRAEEAVRDIIATVTQESADDTNDDDAEVAPGAGGVGDDDRQTAVATRAARERIAALYASFLDTAEIKRRGLAPLEPLLIKAEEIVDGPSLANWAGWATRRGIRNLVNFSVDADPGDPQRVILFIGQSGIGLPDEEYYRDESYDEIRKSYIGHLEKIFSLTGSDTAEDSASRVMRVESAIAALHWDKVRTRDLREMYNLQSRTELSESSAGISWKDLLAGGDIPEAAMAEVVNAQPSYFSGLGELIAKIPIESWVAWARWQTITAYANYLSEEFVAENFAFYGTILSGTPVLRERWKRGVALVEGAIGEDVGRLYVKRHYSADAQARMDQLVANVIEAYRESIGELDWMTEVTRAEALRKLGKFRAKIGYPAKWKDYSALHLDRTDLIGNVVAVNSWSLDDQLDKLTRPTDPDEWFMTPQTVNAYYHPLRNEIVFPAAILQPPFFDAEADDALNYGGIGAVIGHEIGHGFDDQGSTCDGDGTLRDWWTAADRAAFEKRTAALIGQYGALSPAGADGKQVNGELTIGENIGDLGGLGIAHRAWQLTGADPDAIIDGTPNGQRIFLNWAAIWRTKSRPETVKQRLATDPHSPPEFRANQTARNIDAFHQAFDTSESDALWLAPEDRVRIW